jgi:hypothetical protein
MGDTYCIPQSILFLAIGSDLVSMARTTTFNPQATEPYSKLTLGRLDRTHPCAPRKAESMQIDRITSEDCAALIERAGLSLNQAQFEAALRSYGRLRELAESLRIPRNRAAEPAHLFHVPASPHAGASAFAKTETRRETGNE